MHTQWVSNVVGASDDSLVSVGVVASQHGYAGTRCKKDKEDTSVAVSILEAVSRMEAAMEKDCIYTRTISVRERVATLQVLQHKYCLRRWRLGYIDDC